MLIYFRFNSILNVYISYQIELTENFTVLLLSLSISKRKFSTSLADMFNATEEVSIPAFGALSSDAEWNKDLRPDPDSARVRIQITHLSGLSLHLLRRRIIIRLQPDIRPHSSP